MGVGYLPQVHQSRDHQFREFNCLHRDLFTALRNLNCYLLAGVPRLRAQPFNDMREEPFHVGVRKWPRARQQG